MKCQLVLQFPFASLQEYDAMIALEGDLIQVLGDSAHVDGHDAGSGEMNIFILTDNPQETFERAKTLLERNRLMQHLSAGHRELDGKDYVTIWPVGSKTQFTIK